MPRESVLIAVKTYPTLSDKYAELACTAGFRKDGSWVRLYPIPFRRLENVKKFKKYQWLEADIAKNNSDIRPESFKIINTDTIQLKNVVGTQNNWAERKRLVLDKNHIHTNLETLIRLAHTNELSLAIFKPTTIDNFTSKKVDDEWPDDKLFKALESLKQKNFFEDISEQQHEFKIMPKLPYKFSYTFTDDSKRKSTLMIEDWEIGQLYWNCRNAYEQDIAVEKVRQKYIDDFTKTKDLYFFLGTTLQWHVRKSTNPFVIIGTFHPPIELQPSFL